MKAKKYTEEQIIAVLKEGEAGAKVVMAAPVRPNQHWFMDFVTDSLVIGRCFRALTIVDDYSRECPAIEVDTSLGGRRVVPVSAWRSAKAICSSVNRDFFIFSSPFTLPDF